MRHDLGTDPSGFTLGTTPSVRPQRDEPRPDIERQPLRATFLGVTTILLADGATAIMTDGFFSRPGLAKAIRGAIAPDTVRIDNALKRAGVVQLAAVLTAHSHHDHAMDTAIVAAKTGAEIIGSQSTRNIALGLEFPDNRIRVIAGGEQFTFGRFQISVIPSPHSPHGLFKGEVTSPLHPPAGLTAYKEGGNYSFLIVHEGRRVLIHPSANFSPGFLSKERVDVVFLGIGTLGTQRRRFIRDYWREVVATTGAKLVIPVHWDNFFKPLDEPLAPAGRGLFFNRAMRALNDLSKDSNVVVRRLTAFETIDLSAFGR